MDNIRFSRTAGLLLIIGALVGVGCGVREGLFPTTWGTSQFVVMQVIVLIANTLVLIGVIGLARSGAAGESRLAKIGLGIAVLGSALFLPFEVFIIVNLELGGMLLTLCALLQGLGLLLAGIAVLRAGRWHGWHRLTPLLCGLYPYLVLIPAFAVSDGYNAWALAGWQIPFVLLGLALSQQRLAPAASTAAVGA
ncbi:MAG TPA: hypothetical protein VF897_00725 [Roseiflexaceae bacterium]